MAKKKSDKNWIQKATASIKRRGTEGKCTPITKPGCTGRAKALAKTFKKMAKNWFNCCKFVNPVIFTVRRNQVLFNICFYLFCNIITLITFLYIR